MEFEIGLGTVVAVLTGMLAAAAWCYWRLLRLTDELMAERDAQIARQIVRAMRASRGAS